MRSPQKPVASFIFAGPDGCRENICSQNIWPKPTSATRKRWCGFDMSEYMERHTVISVSRFAPGLCGF